LRCNKCFCASINFGIEANGRRKVTRHDLDLAQLSRQFDTRGIAVSNHAPEIRDDTVLLKGSFNYLRLRQGLTLHTSDVTEVRDLEAYTEVKPGLSFLFFSRGEVDVRFGKRDFHFGDGEGRGEVPEAFIINRAEPELFSRQIRAGAYVRKLVITVSPDWLDIDGLVAAENPGSLKPLLREHLSLRRFVPSPRLHALIEQTIQPQVQPRSIQALYMESRALELVAEMLAVATQESGHSTSLGVIEQRQMAKALAFIDERSVHIHSIDDIARHVGISPSSLQRLFRKAKGCSLYRRLYKPRELRHRFPQDVRHHAFAGAREIEHAAPKREPVSRRRHA
jgi:AraC-like DNA-binding protein